MHLTRVLAGPGMAMLVLVSGSLPAAEPCPGFSWDVSAERQLFAGAPTPLLAGRDRASAPTVVPDRLVELTLVPLGQVSYAATPGRATPSQDALGGLAMLTVPRAGPYRISVNQGVWIDVVAQGQLVPAVDYEGSRSCDAPHKVVVFNLPAGRPLTLQFSGASAVTLRVTVTRVPGSLN